MSASTTKWGKRKRGIVLNQENGENQGKGSSWFSDLRMKHLKYRILFWTAKINSILSISLILYYAKYNLECLVSSLELCFRSSFFWYLRFELIVNPGLVVIKVEWKEYIFLEPAFPYLESRRTWTNISQSWCSESSSLFFQLEKWPPWLAPHERGGLASMLDSEVGWT